MTKEYVRGPGRVYRGGYYMVKVRADQAAAIERVAGAMNVGGAEVVRVCIDLAINATERVIGTAEQQGNRIAPYYQPIADELRRETA